MGGGEEGVKAEGWRWGERNPLAPSTLVMLCGGWIRHTHCMLMDLQVPAGCCLHPKGTDIPWRVPDVPFWGALAASQCPAPVLPSPRVPAAGAISIHVAGLLLSLSRLSGQAKEICPSKNENHLSQGSSSLVRVVSLPARGMTDGSQRSPRGNKGPSGCGSVLALGTQSGSAEMDSPR